MKYSIKGKISIEALSLIWLSDKYPSYVDQFTYAGWEISGDKSILKLFLIDEHDAAKNLEFAISTSEILREYVEKNFRDVDIDLLEMTSINELYASIEFEIQGDSDVEVPTRKFDINMEGNDT